MAAQGGGEADCPEGTIFLDNFAAADLVVGLELAPGVTITAVTEDDGGEPTSVTVSNESDGNITIAVKGGSDQTGNFVTIAAGDSATISVTDNPTISNLSVCEGPEDEETPSLTLDKVAVNGDDEFAFTLGGAALGDTLSGADAAVVIATEAGSFTIAEALTAAQIEAGWSLTSISCEGNATAEVVDLVARTVTVTVGADEDVVCTFTDTLVEDEETPSLTLDKVAVGDAEFAFTLGGAALGDTLSGADAAVVIATEAGSFVIVEALTQAQIDAGWSLTTITCEGNATAEVVDLMARTVTVTVGADEDVVCTFTNIQEGEQPGGGPGGQPGGEIPREGTQGGNPLPNTATSPAPFGQMPVALLALLLLAGLGTAGYAARAEARRRR